MDRRRVAKPVCVCLESEFVEIRLTLDQNSALDSIDRDEIRELYHVFMFKTPIPPLQMDSWTKCLDTFIFVSFLRKF